MTSETTHAVSTMMHLSRGRRMTPILALEWYGCFRLAAVIFRLRKEGHAIQSERVPGARHHAYWIER